MNTNNKNNQLPTLGRWTLVEPLGSGGTAQVYLGYDLTTRQQAAVKIFTLDYESSLVFMKIEEKSLKSSSHPNIISLIESYESIEFCHPDTKKSKRVCAIAMEYASKGGLFEFLEENEYFLEDGARLFFTQLISGLSYLHEKKIAHGDIKLENIMLDDKYTLKLADFGHSSEISPKKLITSPAGTPGYYAPEVHAKLPYSAEAADLFAAGIVLFAMVAGHMPFVDAVEKDKLYGLFYRNNQSAFWEHHERLMQLKGLDIEFSESFKDLVEKMLHPNPTERLTLEEIQNHPWMKTEVMEVN